MRCLETTHRIPLDVILEILVWLPAKSALRFKCVCKEWYNLINTPHFTKLHLNKSLEPNSRQNRILVCIADLSISIVDDLYHPLKWIKLNWPMDTVREFWPKDLFTGHGLNKDTIGSCNGLLCFNVNNEGRWPWPMDTAALYSTVSCFLICNPTTRTFKSILPSSETKWTNAFISYGFGYDSEHDDYKIVGTRTDWRDEDGDRHVFIYSLKTDLWTSPIPLTRVSTGRFDWTIKSLAIFVNNMLHYLVLRMTEGSSPMKDYKIARFDIVSEKWRDDLSLPVQVNGYVGLGVLDGWLYLNVGEYDIESSDVWMMEEYGSWKKMYHLPKVLYKIWPIALSKDGSHRLFLNDCYDYRPELFWYDQRHKKRTLFALKKLPKDRQKFMLCIASLVAIPDCSLTKLQQVEEGD